MRQREQDELSAEARRELEALDRALAGQPVDAELDAVAQLARELRASRPELPDDVRSRLDERAASGFAGSPSNPADRLERLRAWFSVIRPIRVLAPAGAVATVVLVAGVAVVQNAGDGTDPPAGDGVAREEAAQEAAPAGGDDVAAPTPSAVEGDSAGGEAAEPLSTTMQEPTDDFTPVPPPDDRGGLAPGREDRAVERNASIALSSDPDEFEDVSDGVIEVTDRYGGIVVSSEESSTEERSSADFELAVPAEDLTAVLADLSELGHVESRSEDSLDITAPTVDARNRLEDARAEVDVLLEQLARADSPSETRDIRLRLDIARSEVAAAKAEVQRLDRRADLATVMVTVTSDGSGDGEWGVSEALEDIEDAASAVAGAALIAAAIVVPLALLIALAVALGRGSRRRRRERALDHEAASPPPPPPPA